VWDLYPACGVPSLIFLPTLLSKSLEQANREFTVLIYRTGSFQTQMHLNLPFFSTEEAKQLSIFLFTPAGFIVGTNPEEDFHIETICDGMIGVR